MECHTNSNLKFIGVPVKLSKGIADEKQQSNLHTQVISWYPNWLFGCPAWGTEPNSAQQLRYDGIQSRILFGMI